MNIKRLHALINELRQKHGEPVLNDETFVVILSTLEAKGYIETCGQSVIVLKEYEGGLI